MIQVFNNIWNAIEIYVYIGLAVLLVLAIVTPFAIRLVNRLFKRCNKEQWKALNQILCLPCIVEFYAPSKQYKHQQIVAEGQQPKNGFRLYRLRSLLSPYSKAVRATHKRNLVTKGWSFTGAKQIRQVARLISFEKLTEQEKANYGDKCLKIKFFLNGHAKSEFKFADNIKSCLGAYAVSEKVSDTEVSSITFYVSMQKIDDYLTEHKWDKAFLDEHLPKSPQSFYIGMNNEGKPVKFGIHHTLICGVSGAGKSSPQMAILYQLSHFVKDGYVKLYGIDPKGSEFRVFEQATLFEQLGLADDEPMFNVLETVWDELMKRKTENKADLENGVTGRQLKISKEKPLIALFIDEMPSFLIRVAKQKVRGQNPLQDKIDDIMRLGRSLNIYLISASQNTDKDTLGNVRLNSSNKIVLRVESKYASDLFLNNASEKDNSLDASLIPPSNAGNGYKTAGIGFMLNDDGHCQKVRFPYLSDDDLKNWVLSQWHKKPQQNKDIWQVTSENKDLLDEDEMPDDLW